MQMYFFLVQRKHSNNKKQNIPKMEYRIFFFFIIPLLQLELDICKYPASSAN